MPIPEEIVPILHVRNAREAAEWYAKLGFEVEGEHRFSPGLPLYLFLARGSIHLHLSEHKGDARPDTLLYFYVHDVDQIATAFDCQVVQQPWAHEVSLTDPDGNRIRVGERKSKA